MFMCAKQNVNRINKVMSCIGEVDISNLHKKTFVCEMHYDLQGSQCHIFTGKRVEAEVRYLYAVPLFTLMVTHN